MPRRIIVSGASGLIGSALVDGLRAGGDRVVTLVRRPARTSDEVEWLTDTRPLDPQVLEGADAVVNLNGASIGRIPWTPRYKSTLLWSRLTPTRTLATALRALARDAPHFVSASAVGYYGSRPGRRLTEHDSAGEGFLARVSVEWEKAARGAGEAVALTTLRTAPVVHPEGVLSPLLTLTRLGLGGPIGRGTQVWPWIALTDEVAAIRFVIDRGLTGPVNLAGPERATANDLGFALARRMNKPFLLRAPTWALRTALGRDMADSVLTTDAHVVPEALQQAGFTFTHADVEDAIAAVVPQP
ncbi:TIGR01777 family oxidoreductase [Microbacterium sp. LRZ72]|uniref:TIGR01777 family oxidoreductase n=1 Tax=Microbacterium sp. LRZ72 TaxID=2942481 RepID=UPI0029B9C6FF|nr:TIGR01777 family oxidoreductase [Microbacterium sp. LRZ72]MDX2377436.1 TIGR01777 family oxidoreductase [Microbacterium sp. LRZ72]